MACDNPNYGRCVVSPELEEVESIIAPKGRFLVVLLSIEAFLALDDDVFDALAASAIGQSGNSWAAALWDKHTVVLGALAPRYVPNSLNTLRHDLMVNLRNEHQALCDLELYIVEDGRARSLFTSCDGCYYDE